MSATELLMRDTHEFTDDEARQYRQRKEALAAIEANQTPAAQPVTGPASPDERGSMSAMGLLNRGSDFEQVQHDRRNREIDELRRRAAS